jgi:archaemetzincin
MSSIYLAPGYHVSGEVIHILTNHIVEIFDFPIKTLPDFVEADDSYDYKREQYSSVPILRQVIDQAKPDTARILGITNKDIFIPMLSFIFGQAQLGGIGAIISLARLRQNFYGLPDDDHLYRRRICKEAVHELGHTFGLTHCMDMRCVMSLSTSIEQVDIKEDDFCGACRTLLVESIATISHDNLHGEER